MEVPREFQIINKPQSLTRLLIEADKKSGKLKNILRLCQLGIEHVGLRIDTVILDKDET